MSVASGMNHDAVTSEDLIAYGDGEATREIAERIAADPSLRAAADEYRRAQRRLQGHLYRFACPSPLVLGEYDLGLLDPMERTRIAAHVVGCPRCAEELRTLRDFLAAEDDMLPIGAIERMRRIVATLLPPPLRTSPYANLRGADDATTRTYQAGDVTITLDLGAPVRRGRTSLVGLLWRNSDDPETVSGSPAVLIDTAGARQMATIDDVGNFTFDDITPGAYQLELTLGDDIITIEGLPIGQ